MRSADLSVARATVGTDRDGTVPPAERSTAVESRLWPCPTCDDVRVFLQPPCADGHTDEGGECPEWACADCGTAS